MDAYYMLDKSLNLKKHEKNYGISLWKKIPYF